MFMCYVSCRCRVLSDGVGWCYRNWRQFRLLLWKNWLLQKKQVIRTVLIVLYPIFVCSVLVVMREIAKITFNKADLTFRSFSVIPSFAAYPILQADSIIAHIPDTPLVARILNRAATIMGIDFLQSRPTSYIHL